MDEIPNPHSTTYVPSELVWIAFRQASTSGGNSPEWTECGDDPEDWREAPNPAGTLCWRHPGRTDWHVPHGPAPPATHESVVAWLLDTAAAQGFTPDDIIGVYRSSGGRCIYLVAIPDEVVQDYDYFVCVSRREMVPRFGHSEAMLARLELSPVIVGEDVPHVCD